MGNPGVFRTLGSEILLQEWYKGQPWQNGFQNIILLRLEEDSHRHDWTKKTIPGTDFWKKGNPGVFCTLGSEILLQEWYKGQPWQNGFQNIILLRLEEDSHRHDWTKKTIPGTDFWKKGNPGVFCTLGSEILLQIYSSETMKEALFSQPACFIMFSSPQQPWRIRCRLTKPNTWLFLSKID
jgi:hypothetical protein